MSYNHYTAGTFGARNQYEFAREVAYRSDAGFHDEDVSKQLDYNADFENFPLHGKSAAEVERERKFRSDEGYSTAELDRFIWQPPLDAPLNAVRRRFGSRQLSITHPTEQEPNADYYWYGDASDASKSMDTTYFHQIKNPYFYFEEDFRHEEQRARIMCLRGQFF